jgi:adenine-specific DNA-methyltransferase
LVFDSFGGSGTTAAVAHKMGRHWITVELGEHCNTHIIPRLKKVIDGKDSGGVTESQNWKGGGGFRYYKLAPSLLTKDKWDNWVINKDYNANMLAAAVCKHEGFTYNPSETEWWAHGYSTETDFIYVTTQTLTEEQLLALSEDVGSERTLLVCCSAFKASAAMLNDKLSNITLKKMPHALLSKCEWGKDDYSLNISQLPVVELDDSELEVAPKKKAAKKEADLFGEE